MNILTGSRLAAHANVELAVIDSRTRHLWRRIRKHNLVTDAGLNLLRDLMYGDDVAITHGAVGTDATAPAAGDTTLGAEVLRDTIAQRTKGTAELTVKFVVGSQQANGSTLREAGLLNAASGGTLYARVTPTEIAKTDSILVIYTWTLSFAVA